MKDKQIENLTDAITKIAHGNERYPMGLEALVMALRDNIAPGLHDIADAIRELAKTHEDKKRK